MGLPEIDTTLFFIINRDLQNSILDAVMPFVTGNAKLLFLPLVIWTFLKEERKAWEMLAVGLVAVALADGSGHLMKDLFARQRPCNALDNVHLLVGCSGSFSMPSNHASNAFGFAMVYPFYRRNALNPLFLAVAALVGISRVYVGVHYPFDVVAGSIVGALAAYASVTLYKNAIAAYRARAYEKLLYLLILVVSLFRVYYILTTPFDLSADEAHYWEWSRRPALSYYSKGPAIAYLIWLGTAVFGNTVFGVRVFAVVLSALSSIILFRLAKGLYDEKTGLASALLFQITPAFSVFGALFTIDSPFIFFWLLALFLFYKAAGIGNFEAERRRHNKYWVLLGISIGLGLLTKYTMVFFPVSALLMMLLNTDARKHLSSWGPYVALMISLLLFFPVIVWNAANGWVTVRHTAGQAHLADGLNLSPMSLVEFAGSQFGIITPLLFILMMAALWKMRGEKEGGFLFWFTAPIVTFFLLKSIQGKVQANWAIPGYAPGLIAFAALFMRNFSTAKNSLKIVVVSSLIMACAVTAFAHYPSVAGMRLKYDPASKLTGWKELGREVSRIVDEMSPEGSLFIFSNRYQVSSELAFYVKGNPVTYCVNTGRRMNQYDLWPGLDTVKSRNAVFVMIGDENMPPAIVSAFGRYENISLSITPRRYKSHMKTGDKTMKFTVFKCYDFRGITTRPAETY